jgi:hypothetical protein
MVLEDECWRSGIPWIVNCGACTITLHKMNYVSLQIVQNECEQIFSVAQTADAKLVDDVL